MGQGSATNSAGRSWIESIKISAQSLRKLLEKSSMARIKSIVSQVDIDVAQKSHNCQGNARHRIDRGDSRLKLRNGRSWDHYCLECAKMIVQRDLAKLQQLADRLGARAVSPQTKAQN